MEQKEDIRESIIKNLKSGDFDLVNEELNVFRKKANIGELFESIYSLRDTDNWKDIDNFMTFLSGHTWEWWKRGKLED